MDVDNPSNLKRSSSAPMINELNATNNTPTSSRMHSPARSESGVFNLFSAASLPRTRRFSASCSPLVTESPRLSSARVTQLRREERLEAVAGRELEHERELHSQMQMSQSCEDLALLNNNGNSKDVVMARCSSPSSPVGVLGPFSPGADRATPPPPPRTHPLPLLLRQPLSPSPTRKSFMSRRSLSPIAMRPSALTPVKRKFDLDQQSDSEHMGSPCSSSSSSYPSPPAKRLNVGTTSLAFGPDGLRSAPLSPGGGRFFFRPLSSSQASASSTSSSPSLSLGGGAASTASSLRDEPMLDEEEEMALSSSRHKSQLGVLPAPPPPPPPPVSLQRPQQPQQPQQQQQQQSQQGLHASNSNSTIKDSVMTSVDPS